ncbi:MAG: gamma-glutamyltransferase [Pelagerythrobacter marensis]|nr:MAG: gamma-glutamyltransferase [Pelagerythrobacter marensis]
MAIPFRARAAALIAPLLLGACTTLPAISSAIAPPPAGIVSAADPRAEAAGEAMLAQGGSATDAAIAIMLALTVVEPQSSGIGGGGFFVHGDERGTVETLDGRETAPAAASPQWLSGPDGSPLRFDQAVHTGLSVGVPGNIALAAEAHRRHGKLPWAALFEPAIALARDGFAMNQRLRASLVTNAGFATNDPVARRVFTGPDGQPQAVGSIIRQPELAATFERLAAGGPEAFYRGAEATALAERVRAATPGGNGMTAADIAGYRVRERAPVCGTYRRHRICGMGPPSSGGIAVLQMLGQLERFDLAALGPQSPQFWHLFLESQRLAYADRELYIGDPDFVSVPVAGLLDPAYLARRSALIDPARRSPVSAGRPTGAPLAALGTHGEEQGTSHFSVLDSAGRAVSYTSTIESAFGSSLMHGGFYLNNELTDFSFVAARDGRPVANRVEGGKRPRSSMAPMLVYDPQGRLLMIIGAAGGGTIPVQIARSIIGVVDFGLSAEQALALPLVMEVGSTIMIEQGSAPAAALSQLEALGHGNFAVRAAPVKANILLRTPGGWVSAREPRMAASLGTTP